MRTKFSSRNKVIYEKMDFSGLLQRKVQFTCPHSYTEGHERLKLRVRIKNRSGEFPHDKCNNLFS